MFDGPEYASYIQLCRELRLERAWALGDWYWWGATYTGPVQVAPDVRLAAGESRFFEHGVELVQHHDGNDGLPLPFDSEWAVPRGDHLEVVWLPRLDQWLAMWVESGRAPHDWFREMSERSLAVPEVAAARLWMAVTGYSPPSRA